MNERPQILTHVYDFLLYLIPQIAKLPKNQRYTLGDRIETTALGVFEKIVEALYTKDKILILQSANIDIEKVRLLIRLAKDLRLVNLHGYEVMTKRLHEIGIELGGWIKDEIRKYLATLNLVLHEGKCHVFKTGKGVPFLGMIVFPHRRRLKRENMIRFKRRLKRLQKFCQKDRTGWRQALRSIRAWIDHPGFAKRRTEERCAPLLTRTLPLAEEREGWGNYFQKNWHANWW